MLEVGELELVRYYILLLNKNFGVDIGFYFLGFCIMKYNFKINEDMVVFLNFIGMYLY